MRDPQRSDRLPFLDGVIEKGMLLLVLFPPLAFGAVHDWSSAIMQLIAYLVFGTWLVRRRYSPYDGRTDRLTFAALGLFLLFVIMQLIPLPNAPLSHISPETTGIYRSFLGPDTGKWMTITLEPGRTLADLLRAGSYVAVLAVVVTHYRDRSKIKALVWAIIALAA